MSALEWLGEIGSALLRIVPRLRVIPSTHAGVAFVRGRPRPIAPGCLCLFWPLWTTIVVVPVVRQTLNLPSQTLMATGPGGVQAILVSGIVVYEIRDIRAALTQVHDLDEAVCDLALASIKEVLWKRSLDDMATHGGETDSALRQRVAAKTKAFGLRITNVFLSDCAPCLVIKSSDDTRTRYLPMGAEIAEE